MTKLAFLPFRQKYRAGSLNQRDATATYEPFLKYITIQLSLKLSDSESDVIFQYLLLIFYYKNLIKTLI